MCAFRPPGSLSGVRSRAGSRSAHVERTFGWINQFRRLARDYERHARKAAAFVRHAMIRLMLRRPATSP
nr:transposase [Xanthobacter autotrophicus]